MKNKKCILCDGEGYVDSISDCCSEQRNPVTQICSYCHDFCGAVKCPECDGRGYLADSWNEEDSPPMELWEMY
jgi:hypothetical protein